MKVLSLVLILALTISAAFADNPAPTAPDAVHVHGTAATVTQDIRVVIPHRFALHIDDTTWRLDLTKAYDINRYCRFVSKAATLAPTPPTALSMIYGAARSALPLPPAAGFGYPAIRPEAVAARHITNADKGYLFCVNRKVVQKFANDPDGWRFTITVAGAPDGGFGWFAIADRFRLPGDAIDRVHHAATRVADGTAPLVSFSIPERTTYGWLNNYIEEGFFFDGSEVAGTYDLVVTYTLTGL
jgi:hypothetical protein